MLGTPEENTPCHHCGAEPGERHRNWDDIARCAVTGRQLISCHGAADFLHELMGKTGPYVHDHECKPDIWDGEWPGVKACREFGWFTDPNSEFKGREDLNRLVHGAIWNPTTERYEKR